MKYLVAFANIVEAMTRHQHELVEDVQNIADLMISLADESADPAAMREALNHLDMALSFFTQALYIGQYKESQEAEQTLANTQCSSTSTAPPPVLEE